MRRWVSVGFLLGALSLGSTLDAQSDAASESPLAVGVQSLSFNVTGDGTGSFGYWRMRSERTNVGLEIGFGGEQTWSTFNAESGNESDQSTTRVAVSVGPRFRRYTDVGQRVSPFVQTGASVGFGYQRSEHSPGSGGGGEVVQSGHSVELNGSLGIGAEWFPLSRVSLSGYTGVNAGAAYATSKTSHSSANGWRLRAGTFTTGLSFRIYFIPGTVLW